MHCDITRVQLQERVHTADHSQIVTVKQTLNFQAIKSLVFRLLFNPTQNFA